MKIKTLFFFQFKVTEGINKNEIMFIFLVGMIIITFSSKHLFGYSPLKGWSTKGSSANNADFHCSG